MKIQLASQLTQNSNSIRNFYTKIKKDFLEAVYGCFVLKIGILWFRDIEKRPLSLSYEVPPLARPITQYNGIMEYARFYENVRLSRFQILHIFANFLCPFAFQYALESPKSPNSNYLKLTINKSTVLWSPLYSKSKHSFEPPMILRLPFENL